MPAVGRSVGARGGSYETAGPRSPTVGNTVGLTTRFSGSYPMNIDTAICNSRRFVPPVRKKRIIYRQPAGPDPLNRRDELSGPASRQESLNSGRTRDASCPLFGTATPFSRAKQSDSHFSRAKYQSDSPLSRAKHQSDSPFRRAKQWRARRFVPPARTRQHVITTCHHGLHFYYNMSPRIDIMSSRISFLLHILSACVPV